MTIQLSADERTLLVDSLRRLLEGNWPVEGAVEMAQDPAAVGRLSSSLCDMGLASLGANDGAGLSEALLVQEELGRASCPAPLVGALLANLLLEGADDEAARDFLAQVQAGQAVVAVALASFDGDRSAGEASFASGQLTASLKFVEDVAVSSHLLVLTNAPLGVAVVPANDAGVVLTADPGLAVPALHSVTIVSAPLLWQSFNEEKLADASQVMRLLTAARALGAAQRGFDLALDHAKVRRQFGHVIGEFQAIQHKLADCFSRLDGVRLLLSGAAEAHDRGDGAWWVFTDAALAFAGPALRQVALEVHHILGAIGYAEEHEAPRHFRRIHADLIRFGGAARARGDLADYLLRPAV